MLGLGSGWSGLTFGLNRHTTCIRYVQVWEIDQASVIFTHQPEDYKKKKEKIHRLKMTTHTSFCADLHIGGAAMHIWLRIHS